jgi:DNA-3-methyladenine glycosylase
VGKKLPRSFYLRQDTIAVARELLGKLIVVPDEGGRRASGMIVETEAYLGTTDRAAHSYNGRRTPRNEVTYGSGGHAYVFFIYGMYYQLNVVLGPSELPHVVLIRAVEPVEGIEIMRERRWSKPGAIAAGIIKNRKDKDLTSGPGKLCIALAIDRSLNGEDLRGKAIWLEEHRSFAYEEIAVGKRIGIDYAGEDAEKPWRFWVKGNEFVSRK